MPITILDYVKFRIGEKDTYQAEDFYTNGVDIMGGCEGCAATIAAYNAYPSRSGHWRCADCISSDGFTTVEQFMSYEAVTRQQTTPEDDDDPGFIDPDDIGTRCPVCGSVSDIREVLLPDTYPSDCFRCSDCDAEWTP